MTPERRAQMRENLDRLSNARYATGYHEAMLRMMNVATNTPIVLERPTVVGMKRVRRARAERLRALKRRPLWRKVYDGIVYVLTGREP